MRIDLHSHSYYSDGTLSPTELITLGKTHHCDVMSLCDHDTINGLDEAQKQADLVGIKLIHAAEISALWNDKHTVHIVGLNIDQNNAELQSGLKKHQDFREQRARLMAEQLEEFGIKDAYKKAQTTTKIPKDDTKQNIMLTRVHFARMLVAEGECKDINSAFKRFLTGNKPGAVSPQWQSMAEVISWIHSAGGLAVVAHPFRYRFTHSKTNKMLADFAAQGGDGIEVVVSNSKEDEIAFASESAKKYNLLASQGSDYHGWQGEYRQLGKLKPIPKNLKTVWQALNIDDNTTSNAH